MYGSKSRFPYKYMGVSKNRGGAPQIIHFNKVFHYKPSILGGKIHPYFWFNTHMTYKKTTSPVPTRSPDAFTVFTVTPAIPLGMEAAKRPTMYSACSLGPTRPFNTEKMPGGEKSISHWAQKKHQIWHVDFGGFLEFNNMGRKKNKNWDPWYIWDPVSLFHQKRISCKFWIS